MYVLKQTGSTYQQVRRLTLPGRILARAFAIGPNVLTLYIPDPGTAATLRQHRHHVTYQLATPITNVVAGSGGAQVLRGRKFLCRRAGLGRYAGFLSLSG